jgi:glycosyltransferase involved in cell wall biosynthesis
MGEGFGVPTIEAQACGTPVIVSNFSAQPELVGDGWIVDSQPWWNPLQEAWFCTPSVPDIVKSLNEAYEAKIKHSTKAVKFAEQYAAETVFDKYWKPILKTFA